MSVQFETPENVTIHYSPAGLGTRFLAFLLDGLFLLIPYLLIVLLVVGLVVTGDPALRSFGEKVRQRSMVEFVMMIFVVMILLWSILGIAYFALFELLMRGQTPGKRIMKLRVVRTGGFALDASSVIIRSIFRVLDNLPLLWLVPYCTPLSQRLGDLVGKTVVVYDVPPDAAVQDLKHKLMQRDTATAATYAFDALIAQKTPWESVLAAEKILLRWKEMRYAQKERFAESFCAPLARLHKLPQPDADGVRLFLEDYLILRYNQQYRRLG